MKSKSEKVEILWHTDDGYSIGRKRDRSIEITAEDLKGCKSFEQAQEVINELVREDFNDKVAPAWNPNECKVAVQRLLGTKE